MADDSESTPPPPRNRKERRAAAKQAGQSMAAPTSTPKMKMAYPDRSKPKERTLLDLYEEKKSLLSQGQPFDPKYSDGRVRDESGNILEAGLGGDEDDEPIGALGQAFFWSVCLAMMHFTLDVLVFNQYRQTIVWSEIWQRSGVVLPVLWLLIYMMRSDTAKKFPILRQLVFFALAVGAGCYTIHVGNNYDYYAVMKRAPPAGTLWVWSVIELNVAWAALSVLVDVGYLWWMGYSAF
jgi:hypothetical protein